MSVRAIKAGATDFLTKPVEAGALVAAVRCAIEQQRRLRRRWPTPPSFASGSQASLHASATCSRAGGGKLNKQIAADLGMVEQTESSSTGPRIHGAEGRPKDRRGADATIAGRSGLAGRRPGSAAAPRAAAASAGKRAERPPA
jgi:hypothetical protein